MIVKCKGSFHFCSYPLLYFLLHMQNEISNPADSLQLIESMINKAKNSFSENGHLYLIWGWMVLFCSIGHFVLLHFHVVQQPEMVWMLTWAALLYQLFYLVRKEKKAKVRTYTDEIIGFVWMVFGICGGISSFILAGDDQWQKLYSIVLMLYGIPTFLSGAIMRFTPLKVGGICCWGLSILSVWVKDDSILLLLALAVVLAWIIPGYLLRKKYKRNH